MIIDLKKHREKRRELVDSKLKVLDVPDTKNLTAKEREELHDLIKVLRKNQRLYK